MSPVAPFAVLCGNLVFFIHYGSKSVQSIHDPMNTRGIPHPAHSAIVPLPVESFIAGGSSGEGIHPLREYVPN